jgi:hypothetical protein
MNDSIDAGGETAPREGERLAPEQEPRTTGTLVILMLFLMALAAMWSLMYFVLLER